MAFDTTNNMLTYDSLKEYKTKLQYINKYANANRGVIVCTMSMTIANVYT